MNPLVLILLTGCADSHLPAETDDDGGIADDDSVEDVVDEVDLELLPCSARTVRDDASVWEREFAYDPAGRLSIERIFDDYPADGRWNDVRIETHQYGEHGVDTETHDEGADCYPQYAFLRDWKGRSMSDSLVYTFDDRGNPLTALGEYDDCTYQYDERDNLVLEDCSLQNQRDDDEGTWVTERRIVTWTWTYDAAGRALSLDKSYGEAGDEHWRWTWNELGQRVREESWQDNRTAEPEVVDWIYDDRGRLRTELRDPDGPDSETTFSYDCWDAGGPDAEAIACTSFRESAREYATVSVGGSHGCGLDDDGGPVCWGFIDRDPPEGTFDAIASGGSSMSCALRAEDASLHCTQLLSISDEVQWSLPEGPFVAVDLGGQHGCALRVDGTIACWGTDLEGSTEPPQGTYASMAVGEWTGCALDHDGLAVCWGRDRSGVADPPDEPFRRIAVGREHACAIALDGALRCWGDAPAIDDGRYTEVAIGSVDTCAIRQDATVACWGELRAPPGRFTALDLTERSACSLREDRRIVCWGDNGRLATTPP